MSVRYSIVFFLVSAGIHSVIASFQSSPGYMDADYYYMVGSNLSRGDGFTTNAIWNYLDEPSGLPHAAHAYWMPLASIVSWAGLQLSPDVDSFDAAQWGFVLAASLVPVMTANLSFTLWKREDVAKFAGGLALFPGFYAAFLTTSDTFGIYMLLGAGYLWLVMRAGRQAGVATWVCVGIVSGFMHLARADGVIWIITAVAYIVYKQRTRGDISDENSMSTNQLTIKKILLLTIGYAAVMAPWFVRNYIEFGVMLNPGGLKTLWMKEYNDLFIYPPDQINLKSWWGSGLDVIIGDRFQALWLNVQTMVAVQGMIFLAPLMIVGWWKMRKQEIAQLAAILWIFTLLLMTLFFPYSGTRGGFFHAGAGLQPIAWGFAGIGFFNFIDWGRRRRGWDTRQAGTILGTGVMVLVAAMTVGLLIQKFANGDGGFDAWSRYAEEYKEIGIMLNQEDPQRKGIVMVVNPPGCFIFAGRSAVAIPSGGEATLLKAADDFGVQFLIVERNHPRELEGYYRYGSNKSGWEHIGVVGDIMVYTRDYGVKSERE